jgi:hypothetical protein
MVFIILTGGKSKRLKGKRGGDKFDSNARGRAEDKRYHRECKLAAERKSLRREARIQDSAFEPVAYATSSAACLDKPKSRDSYLTEDGNTRVTIRYNAEGMAVCAFIRPVEYRR